MAKILLLGSGELGKEFVIAAQRIGQTIIAVDSYENAPAMQVAHGFEVINMLDGDALDRIVAKHQPDYRYATTADELQKAVAQVGMPCVVKPLMSSSGKGQSTIKIHTDIEKAWNYAVEGSRGDVVEVIVEAFVSFNSEITLLTVTQNGNPTLFCAPIGHRQERGDYQESWQPALISETALQEAKEMAEKVTKALGGAIIPKTS